MCTIDIETAFWTGSDKARRFVTDKDQNMEWTVLPELWKTLMSHPTVKSFDRRSAKIEIYKTPWRDSKVSLDQLEIALKNGIALADSIEPNLAKLKKGKKKDFLITNEKFQAIIGNTLQAWCGDTAVLASFVDDLHTTRFEEAITNKKAWAICDEQGQNARDTLKFDSLPNPQTISPRNHNQKLYNNRSRLKINDIINS